jgi:hypothetical protein
MIRYKERLEQNFKGFQFCPDLSFYCWFYSVIQPTKMTYTRGICKRLETTFKRDMILLLNNCQSFVRALSNLCVARKLGSANAWKLFYVRYKKLNKEGFIKWLDDEDLQGKHKPFFVSSVCPWGRRISLRLLGIDPSFNEYFGMYGARGCYECGYSFTGCISCLAHDKLKPHHYMNLVLSGVEKCFHCKCDTKGCNTCLHKTRKHARSEYIDMFGH